MGTQSLHEPRRRSSSCRAFHRHNRCHLFGGLACPVAETQNPRQKLCSRIHCLARPQHTFSLLRWHIGFILLIVVVRIIAARAAIFVRIITVAVTTIATLVVAPSLLLSFRVLSLRFRSMSCNSEAPRVSPPSALSFEYPACGCSKSHLVALVVAI